MVYLEKSQPAPSCLLSEKSKAQGDYKCGDVLDRLKHDFKNKCYICEDASPNTINVEHFSPHKGDINLKFDWNNLYLSCGHCNNIKLSKFTNILDCTKVTHNVATFLKYFIKPFPGEFVIIEIKHNSPEVVETQKLLDQIYNGTSSKSKKLESANLRNKLLKEIREFQQNLFDYFRETNKDEDKEYFLIKIKNHLDRGSNFTAFKRWIVLENELLYDTFKEFID